MPFSLFAAQDKSLALEELDMSRMFGRRTKNRAQAIDALARCVITVFNTF